MQASFDPYILGNKPIEDLPFIKWARFDLSNINGHSVTYISNDIQRMLNTEQNQLGPFLKKAAFYTSTAVVAGLLTSVIVKFGLAWAGFISTKYITTSIHASTYFQVSVALSGLFLMLHEHENANIKAKVSIAAIRQWETQRASLHRWFSKGLSYTENVIPMNLRCQELLNSARGDESRKAIIEASMRALAIAQREATDKLRLVRQLPAFSRSILLSPNISIP